MPKPLTEQDVLNIIREEWQLKKEALEKELDVYYKPHKTSDEVNVISPMLKVKHRKSGYKYTVDSVGTNSVVLRAPEGELIDLSAQEFESEYELD